MIARGKGREESEGKGKEKGGRRGREGKEGKGRKEERNRTEREKVREGNWTGEDQKKSGNRSQPSHLQCTPPTHTHAHIHIHSERHAVIG